MAGDRGTGRDSGRTWCDTCSLPAIYLDPVSGAHLCRDHFARSVEERVWKTIENRRMIGPGDRIAIALSGGKDSSVLLSLLSKLFSGTDRPDMVAITIDEGISGYREATVANARRVASGAGIEHRTVTFSGTLGKTLDGMLGGMNSRACTVCGVFRRHLLHDEANRWGATKVATGHCLDDEAETVLLNYLRGDADGALGWRRGRASIPRIKPLRDIPGKEVALYAMISGLYVPLPECPYTGRSLRADVRRLLTGIESMYPGTYAGVTAGQDRLRDILSCRTGDPLPSCRVCGGPAASGLCAYCRLAEELGCRTAGKE